MNTKERQICASHALDAGAQSSGVPVHSTPGKPDKLIRLHSVEEMTGLKKSTIYAAVKSGDMPAPVRLSARAVGWSVVKLEAWIAGRTCTKTDASKEAGHV
ncbi:helix-turn-helix transcriptional regulator [Rhodoferax sp.]|uniref:helix-turn-helix transcriptional regulator n=1 Tax=Rhodoferax sp. TaxID=50421 RepID=UPI00374C9869